MLKSVDKTAFGRRVAEARQAMGISAQALAERVGMKQQGIDSIEKGKVERPRLLGEIARVLQKTPEELLWGTPQPSGDLPNYRPPPLFFGERHLPIYTSAEGGSGDMLVTLSEPVDIVPRPWFLGTVKEAFGVYIAGESMMPAFEAGDIALVNPKLPPARNKNFIFTSGEDESGEFRAVVKKLLGWSTDVWRVEQYNPSEKFDLPKREFPRALRIVGKYEG